MIPLQVPDIPAVLPDSIPSHQEEIELLKSLPADELIAKVVNGIVTLAINLAVAIMVFYAGRFIINKIYNLVSNIFKRRKVDASLNTFILSMIRILLYFILVVIVIGILGIETSSFLALFASAGVAIGMALSGTLQNFAGGVLILLLKPYKVGDYIETGGFTGTVKEILIFNTVITTPDNKSIIIPNGGLSTGSINNYNRLKYRRVDWIVSISYGNDVDAARKKLLEIVESDPRVLWNINKEKGTFDSPLTLAEHENTHSALPPTAAEGRPADAPSVVLKELGASSVDLRLTAWTESKDYWDLYYEVNEKIYTQLESVGVSFPFPQMDVHLSNATASTPSPDEIEAPKV